MHENNEFIITSQVFHEISTKRTHLNYFRVPFVSRQGTFVSSSAWLSFI